MYKQDLVLNSQLKLICNKIQTINQPTFNVYNKDKYIHLLFFTDSKFNKQLIYGTLHKSKYKKARATFQFFLRHVMFENLIDYIDEICFLYFFRKLMVFDLTLIVKRILIIILTKILIIKTIMKIFQNQGYRFF